MKRHQFGAVERLAVSGLRRCWVPSEQPRGFSPTQLPGLEAGRFGLNALIARKNAVLEEGLHHLEPLRGLVVLKPAFHGLFLAVRAHSDGFSFTEIGRLVLELDGEGQPFPEARGQRPACAGYLWWDGWAHLTTAFNALLSVAALAALPELSSWVALA